MVKRGDGMSSIAVTKVTDSIYCFMDMATSERSNAYLVVGKEKALLFDTGTGCSGIGHVIKRITQLPVTVVLSHWHHDHVGGAHEFDRVYAWHSQATEKLKLRGISHQQMTDLSGKSYADIAPKIEPLAGLKFLCHEEIFQLGGLSLECLHTPGHTEDSICLYEPGNQWLFTGDSLYDGPLYLDLPDSSRRDYVQSLKKLKAKPVKLLLPGHNHSSLPAKVLYDLDLSKIG